VEYSPQTSDATSLGATYTAYLNNTIWDVLWSRICLYDCFGSRMLVSKSACCGTLSIWHWLWAFRIETNICIVKPLNTIPKTFSWFTLFLFGVSQKIAWLSSMLCHVPNHSQGFCTWFVCFSEDCSSPWNCDWFLDAVTT